MDADDWIDRIPHRGPASEWLPEVAERYISLDSTELEALASHWAQLEEKARAKHYDSGRTPNELYGAGMPSPEWEVWETYRVARALAGLCRTLLGLEDIGARDWIDVPAVLKTDAVRRRARIILHVIDDLPDHQRTLETVYQAVADKEDVKAGTIRKSINRVTRGNAYKNVSSVRALCLIICKIGNLVGDSFAYSLPNQQTDKIAVVHDTTILPRE